MTDFSKNLADNLGDLRKNGIAFKRQIGEETIGYVATAMGIIAGLAWNDAVKALIEYVFPISQNTLLAKFLYAVIITAVAVFITKTLLARLAGSKDEK